MNINKATHRDRELQRRKHGHQIDGKSIFEIERIQRERAKEIRRKRMEKQKLQEGEDV